MRTSIFLVVGLFVVATVASAAMFSDSAIAFAPGDVPDGARADYSLYYNAGMSGWATTWAFGSDGHNATYFDPLDNLGDEIHNAYEVVEVVSGWYNNDVDYEGSLYICADDDGEPDFGSPLATVPFTIPNTDPYWATFNTEVDPPVGFNCGEMFWVVCTVPSATLELGVRPASDTEDDMDDSDPQYHSYISDVSGMDWELFGKDWKHTVYADEGESTNSVTPASFGNIKARYE